MVKKIHLFFQNVPKEMNRIANFGNEAYRAHQNHLFFSSAAYRPPYNFIGNLWNSKNVLNFTEIRNKI